mmetsp:Transcript_9650/g.27914  ORF Transcript_9650/g.27914 Transcript_9650/m.27914 type:complete len:97 (-) Transcript_9650:2768-3058(-)
MPPRSHTAAQAPRALMDDQVAHASIELDLARHSSTSTARRQAHAHPEDRGVSDDFRPTEEAKFLRHPGTHSLHKPISSTARKHCKQVSTARPKTFM